jgi:glycosyltransferase involved in cell wall biosynthesis
MNADSPASLGSWGEPVSTFEAIRNVEEVWANHHALVPQSRYEGMPLLAVEAMLCGRPCIATDLGGNSELIYDRINSFLAKAATVEAMNRAWGNRDRLKDIGLRTASDVRQCVSRDPGEDFSRELRNTGAWP